MKSIGIFWKEADSVKHKKNSSKNRQNLAEHAVQNTIKTVNNQIGYEDKLFDLQINLWNTDVVTTNNASSRFKALDFGLICPLTTKEITFLLPFKIGENDFVDLASILAKDDDLLCTVFNENLKKTTQSNNTYNVIECDKFKYVMYNLGDENIEGLTYDDNSKISQLTIKINSDFTTKNFVGCRLFIRFRLILKNFHFIARKRKISNDWLQSAFSSTYMFDIRINDVRELPKKKREVVENENHFTLPKFNKVHFFYMADSEETVENGSTMTIDSRLLEKDRWHKYLGEGVEFASDNIAHHWKKKLEKKMTLRGIDFSDPQKPELKLEPTVHYFEDFNLFFKTEFSDINKKRVKLYVIIVVLLGAISSSLISSLFEVMNWLDGGKSSIITSLIGVALTFSFICGLYYCITRKPKNNII